MAALSTSDWWGPLTKERKLLASLHGVVRASDVVQPVTTVGLLLQLSQGWNTSESLTDTVSL